ncbi:putative leader peptide [Krasilnikovia sp. M28-CT-15]
MSPTAFPLSAAPAGAAKCWVVFHAVSRRYVDLVRVASAACRPGRAR